MALKVISLTITGGIALMLILAPQVMVRLQYWLVETLYRLKGRELSAANRADYHSLKNNPLIFMEKYRLHIGMIRLVGWAALLMFVIILMKY